MDTALSNRCDDLARAATRLDSIAAHGALVLLKASFSATQLVHKIRHAALLMFDKLRFHHQQDRLHRCPMDQSSDGLMESRIQRPRPGLDTRDQGQGQGHELRGEGQHRGLNFGIKQSLTFKWQIPLAAYQH